MVESKKTRVAKSYVAGASWLLSEAGHAWSEVKLVQGIQSARVLLERAELTLNGKDEARERKNAGDRARRARKKDERKPRGRKRGAAGASTKNPPALGMS